MPLKKQITRKGALFLPSRQNSEGELCLCGRTILRNILRETVLKDRKNVMQCQGGARSKEITKKGRVCEEGGGDR